MESSTASRSFVVLPEISIRKKYRERSLNTVHYIHIWSSPAAYHRLARRILLVVSLNGTGIRIHVVQLEKDGSGKSHGSSVRRTHGKSLEGRHSLVVSGDTRTRLPGHWAGSKEPLVVVDESFSCHDCKIYQERRL